MNSVYDINKGVNKSLEFKGLRAQYIVYLSMGLLVLLILFAVMYIVGVPVYASLGIIGLGGYVLFSKVSTYSHKYGEHGLMKHAAYKRVPPAITCRTRKPFRAIIKNVKKDDSGRINDNNGGDNRPAVTVV